MTGEDMQIEQDRIGFIGLRLFANALHEPLGMSARWAGMLDDRIASLVDSQRANCAKGKS
jgi:hypothetical protein